jgi:hypothetical protein
MIRNCRGKYLPAMAAISLHRNNVSRLITSKKGNIFYRDGGGALTLPSSPPGNSETNTKTKLVIDFSGNSISIYFNTNILPILTQHINSFYGGQIQTFLPQWETLTSDPAILQTVRGEIIEFLTDRPKNSGYPINCISKDHKEKIDLEITSLLNKNVIVASSTEPGEYISPIFSVPKKDNKVRLILNLKRLNEHVKSF